MENPTHFNLECLFCRKQIFESSFASTQNFIAIYNIAPILPGHSLIIPKLHFTSLLDLPDSEIAEMMVFAKKITSVLKTIFFCDGFDWTIQDGVSAGQTVPHLHLHIIPRKPHDLPENGNWYSEIPENEKQLIDSQHRERLSNDDYNAITTKLAMAANLIME
ncbi:MAG: HIT family protein [Bacteroidales bacterium]